MRYQRSRWLTPALVAVLLFTVEGCGSSIPWTAALQATAPRGSVMLFNRNSPSGYTIAAADTCAGIDLLTAQVSRPKKYLKLYPVMRTGSAPTGPLVILLYAPYDGAVAAYTSPAIARVEWIGTDGNVLDTMSPVDRWVVEEGTKWPQDVRADLGPAVGRLVALDGSGKQVAAVAINSKDTASPPAPRHHQPIPLAHPCRP
jgi:hypothetical protein